MQEGTIALQRSKNENMATLEVTRAIKRCIAKQRNIKIHGVVILISRGFLILTRHLGRISDGHRSALRR